jgi:GLPGLI family protein
MNRIPILALSLLLSCTAFGQYTATGKIEYERKVNLHRQIEDMMDDDNRTWLEKMKPNLPKFNVTYFDLSFTLDNSLYKPGREPENPVKMMWGNTPASENIVYTDFKTSQVAASKKVFEEKFLVKDTMRKIPWKIMDEVRMIANYKCRKAVGRICDSVYVVAFYTEDIMVSGGPEMFAGLPGMILEIAVPRLYSTWIATKIDITPPKPEDIKAPADKGKKVNHQEMYTTLNSSVSKWGKWAHRSIWWSLL